jgi:hypothetical protein
VRFQPLEVEISGTSRPVVLVIARGLLYFLLALTLTAIASSRIAEIFIRKVRLSCSSSGLLCRPKIKATIKAALTKAVKKEGRKEGKKERRIEQTNVGDATYFYKQRDFSKTAKLLKSGKEALNGGCALSITITGIISGIKSLARIGSMSGTINKATSNKCWALNTLSVDVMKKGGGEMVNKSH